MEQGIHWGIEPEDYQCNDDNISFGDSTVDSHNGNTINYQDILYDGKVVGYLWEFAPYNILQPMRQAFIICVDEDIVDDPHFLDDGEFNELWFAKCQDFVDFIKANPELLKKHYNVTL